MKLGRAVKSCRVRRGLTQVELGEKAGLCNGYVSLLERDQRDPTWSTLKSIARALDVPMCILMFIASERHEIEQLDGELLGKLALESMLFVNDDHAR